MKLPKLLPRSRGHYWSGSKLAKWIYKKSDIKKPFALTMEGWDEWKLETMKHNPLAYWFVDRFLNKAQNFFYYPSDLYYTIKCYINNRWVDKTHLIQTGLTPGHWHEYDTIILNGLFTLLVDYVEVSLAYEYQGWELNLNNSLYHRNRDHGLARILWAMSLIEDDGIHLTQQAINAKELYDLYIWWKDERISYNTIWEEFYSKSKEDRHYNELWAKEKELEDKDTEMLIRLVKIRGTLR